jgi:hypothetical protein
MRGSRKPNLSCPDQSQALDITYIRVSCKILSSHIKSPKSWSREKHEKTLFGDAGWLRNIKLSPRGKRKNGKKKKYENIWENWIKSIGVQNSSTSIR